MKEISSGFLSTAILALVRSITLFIDLAFVSIPIAIVWLLLGLTLGWVPDITAFSVVSISCSLAYFEVTRGGQTPGKFIFRLRARELGNEYGITFYGSLLRLSLLFLLISAVYLVSGIFITWLDMDQFGISWVVLSTLASLISVYTFIRTSGRMALHDVIAGTKIEWIDTNKPILALEKIRREMWYCVVLAVALYVGILTTMKYSIVPEAGHDYGLSGAPRSMQHLEAVFRSLVLSTAQISDGVEDLFEYYDDLHGIIGTIPLQELENNLKILRPGVYLDTKSPVLVPVYNVFVTGKGLLATRFQERIAENLMKHMHDTHGINAVLIEFVYRGSFLETVYPTLSRRMFVYSVPIDREKSKRLTIGVTPQESGWFILGFREMEDYMIGINSLNNLQK